MTYGELTPDQREYLARDKAFIDSLESAYDMAMRGSDHPQAMLQLCDVCKRGFVFIEGHVNEMCEHIAARLSK